ncbi:MULTISPECIES: hypothetical protein [Providencia]|uniref:hypothetical protein n=1 Tax=Providencia TaxID=586 RepID=UPI0024B27549
MDKIKHALQSQQQRQSQQEYYRQRRQNHLTQLYQEVSQWLTTSKTVETLTNHVSGPDRLLHLHYPNEHTLVLRFSPQWDKKSEKIKIALFIFDITTPKFRTQLQLLWEAKQQQWRITRLKRCVFRFRSFFYKRFFQKNELEQYLLDFFNRTETIH